MQLLREHICRASCCQSAAGPVCKRVFCLTQKKKLQNWETGSLCRALLKCYRWFLLRGKHKQQRRSVS